MSEKNVRNSALELAENNEWMLSLSDPDESNTCSETGEEWNFLFPTLAKEQTVKHGGSHEDR